MLPACSQTLRNLPPYLFVKLDAIKTEAVKKGLDLIDLGMGNPDHPSPPHVVQALCRSVRSHPETHRYPQSKGIPSLRKAIADWYEKRFGVLLDPEREVLPLLGSKEGLAHLFFAYLSPSSAALVPSPCYPVHYNGPFLTGAKVHLMPLLEENAFLPDLGKVPSRIADKSKVLLMNYPNNPTGGTVPDLSLFERALHFAKRHGCLVAHDNAYSEITFDGYQAPSFLQLPQARRFGVEFHSLSKTYSMAGWRAAFVVGNAEILANLAKFKSFLDYGIPGFIQEAAVEALTGPQDCVEGIRRLYLGRRNSFTQALESVGWPVKLPRGSMYLWARIPEYFRKMGSFTFAERLLSEEGVVVAPGVGFGPYGEGYIRIALVAEKDRLLEAARRIGRFLNRGSGNVGERPRKSWHPRSSGAK